MRLSDLILCNAISGGGSGGSSGGSGGSDTGIICYHHDDEKEYEEEATTIFGRAVKLSDDVLNPDDYADAIRVRPCGPNEPGDLTGEWLEFVTAPEFPGVVNVGDILLISNEEFVKQYGFTSTGTWLMLSFLSEMVVTYYYIFRKK